MNLAQQRCFNHLQREAVARCPACGRYFCRECITEHEDRVICAACLGKLAQVPLLQRRSIGMLLSGCQLLLGLLLAWFFFYLIGEALIALPTSFHETTLWHVRGPDADGQALAASKVN
ncbi:Rhomboid family protein [Verrucomicrobia bacterium]|nr:Rhomboid family protein [Verrucomicrobiota bacterium]